MKINFSTAIALTFVIMVVAAGIFYGVYLAVASIDVSTVDPVWQGLIIVVQRFFASGPVAFLLAWIYNIYGYAKNYAAKKAEGTTTIKYDINKFYSTVAYYGGGVAIAFIALPAPYNMLGAAVVFFIKLFGSVIKDVFPTSP